MSQYLSKIYPGEFIIDDENAHVHARDQIINGEVMRRGLELPEVKPRGAATPFLKPWDRPLIPRDQWAERIKEREQGGAILSLICRDRQVPASNQDSTNFCWTYGVVTAINVMRAYRNMPYVEFARESVAAPIKGYRNNGGWGDQALAYIVEHGIMPQSLWPRHHYSTSRYNTAENLAIAAQYKVEEFLVLQDRNFAQLMTSLLEDNASGVGYEFWSHEVCAVDPVVVGSNRFGVRIWNSWGNSYGDQGFAILDESKASPDDAVIPVVQMAA